MHMKGLLNITRSQGDPKVLKSGPGSLGAADRLTRNLGWFSIGLGMVELLAPRRLTRVLGMEGMETVVRCFGARELASGLVSLSTEKKIGIWSRVAGDLLDVATLVPALGPYNRKRGNAKLALAMVLGVTALDVIAARGVAARHRRTPGRPAQYKDRSGFPSGVEHARGHARHNQSAQRNETVAQLS
jgi:hypothetical protein